MNNAKMWLVVSPSVGVPVFLGAVAIGSFAVHVAVLSKTSWYSDYLVGEELGTGDAMARAAAARDAGVAQAGYAVEGLDGTRELKVMLPDGTMATAILQPNEVLASASSSPVIATD